MIGRFTMAILAIATVKIATNYLSLEGYGQYAVVYEFLAFFSIAADMGLFTIAVKEMSEDESQTEKIIGNILSLRTILVVAMMTLAVIAVFLIPKYDKTYIPLGVAIASFSVLFTLLNGTISSVLQARLKMHISSISQVIGKMAMILYMLYIVFIAYPNTAPAGLSALVGATGAAATALPDALASTAAAGATAAAGVTAAATALPGALGFYHLIIAGVIGNLIMVLITQYHVRKITPLNYKFDWQLWKKVLLKALPYGTALILSTIYFRIDSILLSLIRTQQEVGIYSVALRILEAFQIIPLYFMNSVLPVLTKAIKTSIGSTKDMAGQAAEQATEKARLIVRYSFDFLVALGAPLLVGAYVLAYPIIFIVSSPQFLSRIDEGFYGSDIALKYLMFALVFQFLGTLFTFLLLSINQQSKILYINLGCVIFKITADLLVIPTYGFRGAALTSIVAEFLVMSIGALIAYKYFKYRLSPTTTVKIIISALVMGVTVKLLQPLSYTLLQNAGVFLLVIIGALVYGAMLLLTGAISKDMLKMLKKTPAESRPSI